MKFSRFTRLSDNGMVKVIQFDDGSEHHVHQKIVSNFPILRESGWICVKPDSKNNLHPYKVDATKNGEFIKSYVLNYYHYYYSRFYIIFY